MSFTNQHPTEQLPLTSELRDHIDVLRERVFSANGYLPQFNLLINDLISLRNSVSTGASVVSIERMLLYGKNLFAPLFSHTRYISLDSSPNSADQRGAYNAHMVSDPRFVASECESIRCEPSALKLESEIAELVLVPNLVHHVRDQMGMWNEVLRILKPGGRLYVFEPTFREVHQSPDDYLRYTPHGLESTLEQIGFESFTSATTGGPFTAIAYCWTQAMQYIDEPERQHRQKWFSEHYKELVDLESRFPTNQVRKYTSFPTAFSLIANKPQSLSQRIKH